MLRIAVCDDESVFQNKISAQIKFLLEQKQIDCDVSCFGSGEELVESGRQSDGFDIAFLAL